MGAGWVVVLDGALLGEVVCGGVEFDEGLGVVGDVEGLVCEAGFEEFCHVHFGAVGECDAFRGFGGCLDVVYYVVAVFGVVDVAVVYFLPVGGEDLCVADDGGEGFPYGELVEVG